MTSHTDHTTMRTAGRRILDLAVVAAVASGLYQFLDDRSEPGVRFGILALIMLATRWGNVPAPFAAAFACFMLLATWASAHHWYRDIWWADEVIHVVTPGSLAAAAYFALANLRVMPDLEHSRRHLRTWTPVLWVTMVGVLAAVLWEFYEWIVEQLSPAGMRVGYTDTVLDLAAGMLGSLVAGALALWWVRTKDSETQERRPSSG